MANWFPKLRKNKNAGLVQQPGKNRLTLAEIASTGGSLRIRDVSNSLWFGAGQPIAPVAPKGTPPRRYAYQPMTNINFSGRDGGVSFAALRRFSDYSIVRAIIESVLDRLCSEKWEFRLVANDDEKKADYKKRNASDPRIKALKQFFRKPDGWQNFRTWSRGLYDDMLVIDAASVWLQRDQQGKIASLVQIDGAEVFPLLDETGQQPDPNRMLAQTANKKADKAYLQKVKSKGVIIGDASNGTAAVQGGSPAFQLTPYGFPAQEMTANELIYAVRNRKTFRKYGFGIIEQSLAVIALGLARQDFQAAYYSSGNVPEFIAFLPPDCPVSKAEELNGYLDSILTGQLSNRRKGFFLPSYGSEKSPNIVFPKANDEVLKDAFDEWIARVLCYFFGMSPTAFIKQVNRATAQQQSEESEEQGLQPYIDWFTDTLNAIIQDQFGFTDIEAVNGTRKEQDAEKQANIDKIYVSVGVKTINEVREQNGDDPYQGVSEANVPLIITATGPVPLDGAPLSNAPPPPEMQPPEEENNTPNGPGGKRPPGGKKPAKPNGAQAKKSVEIDEDDSRHNWPQLSPAILSPKSHSARVRTEVALQKCFRNAKSAAIRGVNGLVARPAKKTLHNTLEALLKRKFDSVQFNLDAPDAQQVLGIDVDPSDFAKEGRDMHPHVTVLFGFDGIPPSEISEVTKGIGQVEITIGNLIAFPENEDGTPLVIEIHSAKLRELHDKLDRLPNHDEHPQYIPHICVGYLKPGAAEKYVKLGNPLKGTKFLLSDLVFSGKDKTMVPLEKLMKDSPEDPDEQHEIDEVSELLYTEAVPYFEALANELAVPYEDSALSGVQQGVLDLNIDDAGMINSINQQASDWARERAAELVGMRRNEEGALVLNPDAKWQITETTRQDIRDIVADSFLGNTNWEDIKTNIKGALETSQVFSDARAEMIARNEIGRSQGGSTWNVWKKSGMIKKLQWRAVGANPCPACIENDGQEVDFGKPFNSGARNTNESHPNCSCICIATAFELPPSKI